MLCQNCKKNDATTHLKRIINGEAAEIHLCGECAKNLGVAGVLPGLSSFSEIFGGILVSADTKKTSDKLLCCEVCGFTFDDIAKTGRPGCPNCYRVFDRRLRPALIKIHGRTVHMGKKPSFSAEKPLRATEIKTAMLEKELKAAEAAHDFEKILSIKAQIRAVKENQGE